MRWIGKDVEGNKFNQFSFTFPILILRKLRGKKKINSQDSLCAGQDINTEPADNKLNHCPSACTIVFNAIYLREFVAVGALKINSYTISLNPAISLWLLNLTKCNNFQRLNSRGRKLTAISVVTNAINPLINEGTYSDPSALNNSSAILHFVLKFCSTVKCSSCK